MNAFIAASTQWRAGSSGPLGLDYSILPFVFRMQHIPRADWPDTFEGIRTLEAEALKVIGEQNK